MRTALGSPAAPYARPQPGQRLGIGSVGTMNTPSPGPSNSVEEGTPR